VVSRKLSTYYFLYQQGRLNLLLTACVGVVFLNRCPLGKFVYILCGIYVSIKCDFEGIEVDESQRLSINADDAHF